MLDLLLTIWQCKLTLKHFTFLSEYGMNVEYSVLVIHPFPPHIRFPAPDARTLRVP